MCDKAVLVPSSGSTVNDWPSIYPSIAMYNNPELEPNAAVYLTYM